MRDQQFPDALSIVGHVVTSDLDLPRGEVRVEGGQVISVGAIRDTDATQSRVADVGDRYVLPGFVDGHVHSLSHPGEGITAATMAAAAGGVTTIVEMPFDAGAPVWDVARLEEKRLQASREAVVDVGLVATVHPETGSASLPALAEAGAVAFKISTFDTDPARFPGLHEADLLEVLEASASLDRPVCVHAESDSIVKRRIQTGIATGGRDPRLHCWSRPPVSETIAVLKMLELAHHTGSRIHLCHLSTARGMDLAEQWRDNGTDVTLETCPHYLVFTEDDMDLQGARLKMNPPLRTADDRDGLWSGLRNGVIDLIASDHAPWPIEDKSYPNIFHNHSGVPGVETMAAVVADAARSDDRLSMQQLVRLLSHNPSRVFGIGARKGDIRPGADADIVIFDPNEAWTIDERSLHSNAGWSPYHGRNVRGRVVQTFSRGELIWDGVKVLGRPGRGQIL